MKNKKILMIISIITLISFIIGFSYAYFTTIVIGNDTASSNITTSGSLKLNFNGTDSISLENSQPGDTDSMTFTVTNTGTLPVTAYLVNFSNVINTYSVKSEMVYEIECISSDAVTCLDKTETEIPSTSGTAITQTSIAPGTTHTYTLTVTFTDTGLPQDYNQNKSLYFSLTINEEYNYSTIVARTSYNSSELFWSQRTKITSITFEDEVNIPVGAITTWDVSSNTDGSIMAYIIDDGLGTSTYELYIQGNGFILANSNSSNLFQGLTNLTQINSLNLFKTHLVTNMEYMFYNCSDLESLDLSSFDTSNVITMEYLFADCVSLSSLDVSMFNTSNVINMGGIFFDLNSCTSLKFDNFDTSKVTNMSEMFSWCNLITALDISHLDTSSAIQMWNMFSGLKALTSLNLGKFDTGNVTDMSGLFADCSNLTSLNVSSFDTSNVLDIGGIFQNCTNLTALDLSTFNTSSATSMASMFSGCTGLTSLDLSTFDTSSVTNMSGMFWDCTNLVSLDLSSFNTSNLTRTLVMFSGCSSLTNIDLRNANFATVTYYSSMFTNITNGINIVVKDATAQTWITSRLTDAGKTGNVTIYV